MNDFFKIFGHNFHFSVVDCAFFVQCAFVAENSSKNVRAGVKKSEQFDLLKLGNVKTCGKFNFILKISKVGQ